MGALEIICSLAIVVYLMYLFLAPPKLWKKLGVTGPQPQPLFGNTKDVMLLKKSMNQFLQELYHEYENEPFFGIYARKSPLLIVKDLDMIKDVLIKDFSSFVDRGLKIHDKVEPLSQHLFSLEPKRWRPLRIQLSPVFTSGKLKEMFYIIQECCDSFHNYLETLVAKNESLEVREITAKFTTDVIGSCAFGLKMNAMSDKDSEFRKMGREVFKTTWFRILRFRIREALPKVYDLLGPMFRNRTLDNFFINSIKQTMDYREKENIVRHDFVDILRELKKNPNKCGDIEMTDALITAQAFVFFVAGFETSSTTISHMLYELAQDHSAQEKLRSELMDELKKCDGTLKYESFKNMKYMHQVFQETLRKYPAVPTLMRKSVQTYTFTGTKLTIPENTKVWIPIYSIHRDPNIYPDPDKFDPERFTEEAKAARHSMTYLPFGTGPRNCIGERFAVYQVKAGLAKILQHFRIDVCAQTQIPYTQDKAAFVLSPTNGIYLHFEKIN